MDREELRCNDFWWSWRLGSKLQNAQNLLAGRKAFENDFKSQIIGLTNVNVIEPLGLDPVVRMATDPQKMDRGHQDLNPRIHLFIQKISNG